jgi:cysteine synthase
MRIKLHKPDVKIVGIIPELGISIQGLRNPNEPYPTQLFRREWFDEVIEVSKKEVPTTYELARRVAREEGLLIGMSAAAIIHISLRKARELGKSKTIVAILPDDGMKYLSTPLFE